ARREGRVHRKVEKSQGASVCYGLRPPPFAGKTRSSAPDGTIFALPRYPSAVLGFLALAVLAAAPGGPDAGVAALPPSARALLPGREPSSPLPLFALDSPDLVAALGPLRVEVGAWAEYVL